MEECSEDFHLSFSEGGLEALVNAVDAAMRSTDTPPDDWKYLLVKLKLALLG